MINNILHNALLATNKTNWCTPLTFIAQEPNSTIRIVTIGSPVIEGLQYKTNNDEEWSTYTFTMMSKGPTIELTNVGDYVRFQNTKEQLSTSTSNYVQFKMTGKIAASGNIQSMLNYSTSCIPYCYYNMFYNCTSLTSAPELPATTLATECYQFMFQGCSLTTAPELPATNLAAGCYDSMFYRCTNLTVAPTLPATTLATECYQFMFNGCTSLNYIKVGFTDWNSTDGSTNGWVNQVSTSGTFVCPEELDTTQRGPDMDYIPEGWDVVTY
jgi:hypothetical protein